jgi:FkbM family methyltransferase
MFNDQEYLDTPLEIETELTSYFNQSRVLKVFDIGSCDGLDAIKYAKKFPNAIVYAFEPLSKNFQLIQNNISKYNISTIIPVELALSNSKGKAEFYVSSGRPKDVEGAKDWDFGNKSSSLLQPNKTIEVHPWLEFKENISVNTDTLANFVIENKISRIDFIHMDVQGAELMVLEGAKDFISNIKMIWLEVENIELYKNQPLATDVEMFLSANGFTKIKDTVNQIAGDQLWINYDFFPKKYFTRNIYRFLRMLRILK